jgi:desulfoferrodoxin (superoxide reductase-like protein)
MKGHSLEVQEIDIDYYISFDHEMHKSHFISFVAYVADDKVLLNRLYPEQNSAVRFPIMRGNGKLYGYCNNHGLWEQSILNK